MTIRRSALIRTLIYFPSVDEMPERCSCGICFFDNNDSETSDYLLKTKDKQLPEERTNVGNEKFYRFFEVGCI